MTTDYQPARQYVKLTPGESVKIARSLQGLTQAALAEKTGIPQGTISDIEANKKGLGRERALRLALALGVHPTVLMFPDWTDDLLAEKPIAKTAGQARSDAVRSRAKTRAKGGRKAASTRRRKGAAKRAKKR